MDAEALDAIVAAESVGAGVVVGDALADALGDSIGDELGDGSSDALTEGVAERLAVALGDSLGPALGDAVADGDGDGSPSSSASRSAARTASTSHIGGRPSAAGSDWVGAALAGVACSNVTATKASDPRIATPLRTISYRLPGLVMWITDI